MGWAPRAQTLVKVLEEFFRPGVSNDINNFCQACPQCQIATRRGPAKPPLAPMPIIDTHFEQIPLDFVGPLSQSDRGYRYMLLIMEYDTRYPKVVLLKGMQVPGVAQALLCFFSRLGVPGRS